MAMAMATPSVSCPSAISHSRTVLGSQRHGMAGEVSAISTNFCAWGKIWVSSFSINCRARENIRVSSFGTGKLDFRGRQNSRRFDSEADFIQILPSHSRVLKIADVNRVYDELRHGADVGGAGDGGETSSLEDENTGKEVQIDLQLPRRRLLVEFTCNVCQTRTKRLVNPEAYKRGTVYVQCGGCEAYHQLVDNLGLVVEYDFREETDSNSS